MSKYNHLLNPLPSWSEGKSKKDIIDFVESVTTLGSPNYVKSMDRIAVFDNDGTLWTEQPFPVQLLFALDRIKELAELNPEMKNSQPFKAFIEKDIKTISTFSKKDIMTFLFKG